MRLLRNSLSNFGAALLPAAATLVTLPFIVAALGIESYGILTMVMAISGYFAIVDINVTAGSVKYVAEFHAKGDIDRTSAVISFGSIFYFFFGIAGALVIAIAAPWLVATLFTLADDQFIVGVNALQLAAIGFFFGQVQMYLNSVVQALHRYDVTGAYEAFFGTLIPIATLLLLLSGFNLLDVITLRIIISATHGMALMFAIRKLLPQFSFRRPERTLSSKLWSFSGYSFLSRLASVTHQQADKLIIGSILGMGALTYYSVASQIVGRIVSFSFRLSNVVYPAASAMEARGESAKLEAMYFSSSRYIAYINGCAVLLLCVFGRELLHYWMGAEFAVLGYPVLLCVAVALFFDSLTTIPSLVNDAFGKPRNTGLFAVVRAFIATFLVWLFARLSGDIGTAALGHAVAGISVGIGFIFFIHAGALPWSFNKIARFAYLRPALVFFLVALAFELLRGESIFSLQKTTAYATAASALLIISGWFFIVLPEHRNVLLKLLSDRRSGANR